MSEVHAKITPRHLERSAMVYLRQSTEKQVRHNTESRRLQYALADRARGLGFSKLEVVDSDLRVGAAAGFGVYGGVNTKQSVVASSIFPIRLVAVF
jgi:hypothetical protein